MKRWILASCVAAAGCSAAAPAPPRVTAASEAHPASPPLPAPARYALAEGADGLLFDARPDSPRGDLFAVAGGARLRLRDGLVVERQAELAPFLGFRSLPARLGAGVMFWSEGRLFHAPSFFAPAAEVLAVEHIGEPRPFLDALVVSTTEGFLRWVPGSPGAAPFGGPALAEAASIDASRGVLVDVFGRATVTEDGGRSYRDLVAQDGFLTGSLEVGEASVLLRDAGGGVDFRLGPEGLARDLGSVAAASATFGALRLDLLRGNLLGRYGNFAPMPASFEVPTLASRLGEGSTLRLAPAALPTEVGRGALTPNGLGIALVEGRLRVFSPITGKTLAEVGIPGASSPMLGCEATRVGADVLLACSHLGGAHVLRVEKDLSVRLEATFPRPGRFVQGTGERFGFEGPCGSDPPSLRDFPYLEPVSEEPAEADPFGMPAYDPGYEIQPELPESAGFRDLGDPDVARFCQRLPDGHWTSRELRGKGTKGLYLWLPGDGGATALLLAGPGAPPVIPSEAVRVLSLDPRDARLGGGQLPTPLPLEPSELRTTIERGLWLDAPGTAIRGWLVEGRGTPEGAELSELLDGPDEEPTPEDEENGWGDAAVLVDGSPARLLPVTAPRGRPVGFTLGANGSIRLQAIPEEAQSFLLQGPLAFVWADGGVAWESVDGGASFRATAPLAVSVEASPVWRRPEAACSELGCALGRGLVRLGWGGAPPPPAPVDGAAEPPDSLSFASPARTPRASLRVACAAFTEPPASASASEPEVALGLTMGPDLAAGRIRAGQFQGALFSPFRGTRKRVVFKNDQLGEVRGYAVPIVNLGAAGGGPAETLGLFVVGEGRGVDVSAPRPEVVPVEAVSRVTSAFRLTSGSLLLLDGGESRLWLVNHEGARMVLPLSRLPSLVPQRFFAGKTAAGAPLLVGVSVPTGEVFASDVDLGRGVLGPVRTLGTLSQALSAGEGRCQSAARTASFALEVPIEIALAGHTGAEGVTTYGWLELETTAEGLCLRGVETSLGELGLGGSTLVMRLGRESQSVVRRDSREGPATCRLVPSL